VLRFLVLLFEFLLFGEEDLVPSQRAEEQVSETGETAAAKPSRGAGRQTSKVNDRMFPPGMSLAAGPAEQARAGDISANQTAPNAQTQAKVAPWQAHKRKQQWWWPMRMAIGNQTAEQLNTVPGIDDLLVDQVAGQLQRSVSLKSKCLQPPASTPWISHFWQAYASKMDCWQTYGSKRCQPRKTRLLKAKGFRYHAWQGYDSRWARIWFKSHTIFWEPADVLHVSYI